MTTVSALPKRDQVVEVGSIRKFASDSPSSARLRPILIALLVSGIGLSDPRLAARAAARAAQNLIRESDVIDDLGHTTSYVSPANGPYKADT